MAAGDSLTYDGTMYSRLNKSRRIIEPTLTRVNHRYRGVRESNKVNLEINQIYTDLNKLDAKITSFNNTLLSNVSTLTDGGTISTVTYAKDYTDTPAVVSIPDISSLLARHVALRESVLRLERS